MKKILGIMKSAFVNKEDVTNTSISLVNYKGGLRRVLNAYVIANANEIIYFLRLMSQQTNLTNIPISISFNNDVYLNPIEGFSIVINFNLMIKDKIIIDRNEIALDSDLIISGDNYKASDLFISLDKLTINERLQKQIKLVFHKEFDSNSFYIKTNDNELCFIVGDQKDIGHPKALEDTVPIFGNQFKKGTIITIEAMVAICAYCLLVKIVGYDTKVIYPVSFMTWLVIYTTTCYDSIHNKYSWL